MYCSEVKCILKDIPENRGSRHWWDPSGTLEKPENQNPSRTLEKPENRNPSGTLQDLRKTEKPRP